MKAVASMVTEGNVLADIGTDHGHVPIALVQREKIPRAIAMDVNQGPLQRAKDNIAMCELEDVIETRLSDGVMKLEPNEAETILIAGMGGELVMRILAAGEAVCKSAKEFVLQPQSDIQKVRKFLRENNYKIVDEDMIFEDGKYYPMMRAIPVEDNSCWDRMKPEVLKACDIYGPILLKNGHPVLRKFLVKQHRQMVSIIATLEQQTPSEKIIERIGMIKEQIEYNESAYTILGAIKDAGI